MNPLLARGGSVEYHAELSSTNARALELAADACARLPALIVAERQTTGRGRGANRWWSSTGALTFSLLLDAGEHRLPQACWPLVSLAAALAIGESLQERLPADSVQLKWPNDVYLNKRKVCGILVESPPVRPARLIVGIGINVNNSLAEAPEDVRHKATSLCDEVGQSLDREQVLEHVVDRFLREVDAIAELSSTLVARWSPVCLLSHKTVHIDCDVRQVIGRCGGIDSSGALLVETAAGIARLYAGVVKEWQ